MVDTEVPLPWDTHALPVLRPLTAAAPLLSSPWAHAAACGGTRLHVVASGCMLSSTAASSLGAWLSLLLVWDGFPGWKWQPPRPDILPRLLTSIYYTAYAAESNSTSISYTAYTTDIMTSPDAPEIIKLSITTHYILMF